MREKDHTDMVTRVILTYLGYILLLIGNTLPWPCRSGMFTPDCTVLKTYNLEESIIGILLVVGLLLIPLAVNLLKYPLNFIAWLSFWLFIYLLIIARLFYWSFADYWFQLIDVNRNLIGPTYLIFPVSLIAIWLSVRPKAIQKRWKVGVAICLVVLILLTSYFFVLSGHRIYQDNLLESPFPDGNILGAGPLLILLGAVFLLTSEFVEMRRDMNKADTEKATKVQAASIKPKKAHNIGYWSAIIVTVSSILPTIFILVWGFALPTHQSNYDVNLLFNCLYGGISLLLPLSFIVLMVSITNYAPSEKKVWTRIGLFLAIMYAITGACNFYLNTIAIRSYPQIHSLLMTTFPILTRSEARSALSFALVGLAGLFILPVFHRGGIELAIRWCFAIIGVATAISCFGFVLSNNRGPELATLPILGAQFIIFPVATTLLAVVFRRAEKMGLE